LNRYIAPAFKNDSKLHFIIQIIYQLRIPFIPSREMDEIHIKKPHLR